MDVPSTIERADIRASQAAAPARRTPAVRALGWLSEIADQPQLISLCAATTVIGIVARNRRLAFTGARMLAGELAATALKSAIKRRIDRTRPHVHEDGGRYRMEPGDGDDDSDTNSFPSGHTAGAVAVARAIARSDPGHGIAAYAAAGAIALIQVPRCQHYPTDLAAGAVVGLAADASVQIAEAAIRKVVG